MRVEYELSYVTCNQIQSSIPEYLMNIGMRLIKQTLIQSIMYRDLNSLSQFNLSLIDYLRVYRRV